jgi:DNA replication initiation complex subunit (GINS family)
MIFRKFLKFIKSLEYSSSSLEAETDIERSELKGFAKADYKSIFQK